MIEQLFYIIVHNYIYQIVVQTRDHEDGWVSGRNKDYEGLFPKDYVDKCGVVQ